MKTNSLSDRIVAAIASIAITFGLAQGMAVLARTDTGAGAAESGAAAGIACAAARAPRDLRVAG